MELEQREVIANIMANYAMSFLGKSYIWGGDDPILGFDCSGLVQEILAGVGLDPKGDQTANELMKFAATNWKMTDKAVEGTIVFFGSSSELATHVAFSIGNGLMIEAGGGGSKTITAKDAIAQNAFVRMRPIALRKDVIAVFDPIKILEEK